MFGALSTTQGMAQKLNLNDAIRIAQENSYSAQAAQFSFMASYWNWRSFKAQLLPAVNLNGYLAGFDHSLVETQKYVDGQVVTDVGNINKMQNYMTLSIDQQIPATSGKISLQSYLRRLDQFSYDETTWTTNPIRISYTQPLKTYNSLKWDKKIAPIEYQIAQRNYLSAMQDIAIRVTTLFFNVLEAQSNYKMSVAKLAERDTLLVTAKRRLALGTMSKSDVLQLELSQLNARVAVNSNRLTLEDRMYSFFSYLRVTDYEQAELIPPYYVPEVLLSAEEVLEKAITNSAHTLEQRQAILSAEQSLAQAKSNKGLQLTLQSQLGLTQSSNKLSRAYQNPLDNEIIGLSHAEREIIALAVKYLTEPLPQYDDLVLETSLDEKRYLEVAALTAIIRYVNALDRGHLQKVQAIRAERKGQELVIHVEVNRRYDLEKGMISQETEFFHEVFGIRPVLKVKRIM